MDLHQLAALRSAADLRYARPAGSGPSASTLGLNLLNFLRITKLGALMKTILVGFVVLGLVGCGTTSGRIGELPAVANASSAGKVVTVRVSSIVGAANGYTVALDGKDLYGIGSGEHAEFLVPAGEHFIAVKCFGGWTPTWKEDSLKFVANPAEVSYFVISPNLKCADIKAIAEPDAKKQLQGSKFLSLEEKVAK